MPKDTQGFSKILEDNGFSSSLVHQTIASNKQHIRALTDRIIQALEGSLKEKTVCLLGLSFKAGTDDIRCSPAIGIIERIDSLGATIHAYDPLSNKLMAALFPCVTYFDSPYEASYDADCIVALTDSREIKNLDLNQLHQAVKGRLILDFRNVFDPVYAESM